MFSDLEIRVLICNRDVEMGLNMVKSLRRYSQFETIPIYFHNDSSLDDEDKNRLLNTKHSFIVDRDYADNIILNHLSQFGSCKRYRFEINKLFNNTKMKLFDFYFLSTSKNILCIDTDILFLNEPKEMVKLIEKSIPFYFPDFQNAYSFSKNSKVDVLEKVNVGIFYIPSKEYYDIDSIEFALNDLFTTGMTNGDWIEQSAWSHMYYKNGNYVKLNEKTYKIPNPYKNDISDFEALHFVGHPPIRELYNRFL